VKSSKRSIRFLLRKHRLATKCPLSGQLRKCAAALNPRCVLPAARCFPPPWLIEEHNDTCFIVKNAQGTGYLLPTNFGGCIQLRRPDPDLAKINRVMRNFSFVVGVHDTGADHRLMARFVTGRKTPLPRSSRTATLTVCVATAANGSAEAACYGWRSRRASLLSRRVGRGIPTHDIPLPRRRSAPNRHPPAPWQSVSSLIPSPLKNSRTNYAKRF